ncbi:MAG: SPOR domain-containing protein [Pseudomonadota bacterium]|nr:SPOR domain-containing protein [Pseudomonadota bacterium]
MEVQVRERLVGALVLVAIVVLFVPALLKGPARESDVSEIAERRSVVIPVHAASEPAKEEDLVPEPLSAESGRMVVDEPLPQAAEPPAAPRAAVPEPEPEPVSERPPAPEPPGPPPDAPGTGVAPGQPAWAVQLGAFSTREKADDLVAKLRRNGYAAFMLEYRADGKVLHRVRVGPEQDRARAAAIAARLRKDGFQPVVAPHP